MVDKELFEYNQRRYFNRKQGMEVTEVIGSRNDIIDSS